MPIPALMTWVVAQRRWTKMYGGRRYYISARKLGCRETKEDSQQAANQWWREKQAELDYAEKAKFRAQLRLPEPMEDIAAASLGQPADLFGNVRVLLGQALLREEEQRQRGLPLPAALPGIREDAPVEILVHDEPEDAETIKRREIMALLERLLFGVDPKLPAAVAEQLAPARVAQVERAVQELKGESVADPARTVQAQVKAWLEKQKIQVDIHGMSAAHWQNLGNCISHFAAFLGETADVSTINGERLEGFHYYCLSKVRERSDDSKAGWSARYAQEAFNVARKWIRWLWGKDLIPMPKNLNDRWRFESSIREIPTWTIEEVRRVIDEARGKLKLALLLAINTGMLQKDVSDLMDTEIDWMGGTITRKRSKSRKKKKAPTVCYKLWPITFDMLKSNRSGQERVLLTKTGKTYVHVELKNGKLVSRDNFSSSFKQLCKRIGFHKPMKQLRKTSASLIESHPVYGRLTSLFLGHAPASMAEKHYAAAPQALLDEAVMWLGQQYGFVDA